MKDYIRMLRPKHYLKNILIFLPLVFSSNLLNINELTSCIFGFLSFCCLASIVYIINDLQDKEKDKLHCIKKNRPIAAEKISIKNAMITMLILFLLMCIFNMVATNFVINIYTWILLGTYLILNILYSFKLKHLPIIDISILVVGFLIRVLYGGFIIEVVISNWLYLTILSAAIYVVLGKRRNEMIRIGTESRKVLQYYTKEFLDKNMYVFLSLTIVFYSLWCIDINTVQRFQNNLSIWTVPIIMLIFMKYSLNIEKDSYGDPVDVLFSDKLLLILVVLYAVFMLGIIYIF